MPCSEDTLKGQNLNYISSMTFEILQIIKPDTLLHNDWPVDVHFCCRLKGSLLAKLKESSHCQEMYRVEAVGLKNYNNTWKITIFVNTCMWNLGQFEKLIFCQ